MKRFAPLAVLVALFAAFVAGCDSLQDRAEMPAPLSGDGGDQVVELTTGNFQEQVLDSDKPVMVDFWATWCGPCKKMSPVVDELADETQGRFVFGKVDIDSQLELAREYKISSIPAFLFFKDGKVQDSLVGGASKAELKERLQNLE